MTDTARCACGCNQTTTTKNGTARRYVRGHNRRGKGTGWRECGYRYVSVDGKKIGEHRHLMEEHLGRKLRSDEVVHHVDGNQLNNDLSNLMVLTRSEHTRFHSKAKRTRWTDEEKKRARELKAAGYSTQDVAHMMKRSMKSTIQYTCNRRETRSPVADKVVARRRG